MPNARPNMTEYIVRGDRPRGAVIVCPGGGYTNRAEHEGEPVARWLNRLGLSAFVVHYRVAPRRHPEPLEDATHALRYVRCHAADRNVDPSHIGVLGFSAGGHLASTLGTHFDAGDPDAADPVARTSSRPDALVLCYPVITFTTEFAHQGCITNLLGPAPSDDLLTDLSTETQVTADTPPTFLWHTADDAGVPVENSLLFAGALSRHGVPFELHVFGRGRHGLGLADEAPAVAQWTRLCAVWLEGQGF